MSKGSLATDIISILFDDSILTKDTIQEYVKDLALEILEDPEEREEALAYVEKTFDEVLQALVDVGLVFKQDYEGVPSEYNLYEGFEELLMNLREG